MTLNDLKTWWFQFPWRPVWRKRLFEESERGVAYAETVRAKQEADDKAKYEEWRRRESARLDKEFAEANAKADELLKAVLDRHHRTTYRRPGQNMERYSLMLEFDPMMFGVGFMPQDRLRDIARWIGKRVESEIASAKFVDKADREEFGPRNAFDGWPLDKDKPLPRRD